MKRRTANSSLRGSLRGRLESAPRPGRSGFVFLIAIVLLLAGCEEKSSQDFYEKALEYRQRGEISGSIVELRNALQKDPENARARLLLGLTYLELRDLAGAEKELLRSQRYGIAPGETIEPLSRTWQLQGQFEKVLNEIPLSNLSGEDRLEALLAHGKAFVGLGRLDAARAAFDEILAQNPNDTRALKEMARMESRAGNFEAADQLLVRLARLDPDDLEAVALTGDIALKAGEFDTAASRYRQVLKRSPGHIATKVALASALMGLKQDEEAEKMLDSVLKQSPKLPDANHLRAVLAVEQEDYETAGVRAEHVLAIKPDHEPSLLIAATAAFALGRLESAERYIARFLKHKPSHGFAQQLLAATRERLVERNRENRTVFLIDDWASPASVASAIDPHAETEMILEVGFAHLATADEAAGHSTENQETGDLLDQTRRMIAAGEPGPAIALLQAALNRKPDSLETRVLLGEAYLRSGRPDETLGLAKTGLKQHIFSRRFLVLAAVAELTSGRASAARLSLRTLEDQDPDAVEVQFLLATVYRILRDDRTSREVLERVSNGNPEYEPALAEKIRLALSDANRDQAARDLERLVDRWPNHPWTMELTGGLALLSGRYSEATEAYSSLFASAPTSLRALRLAYAEQRAGRAAQSRALLEAWQRTHPEDSDVMMALANKHLAAEEFVEAAELYSNVLRLRPYDIVALNNLAWVSLKLGETDVALEHARRALDMDQGNFRVMDTLAEILLARGDSAQALPLLRRAARHDQRSPGLRFRLAQALALEGNPAEAHQVLEQVLEEQGEFPERHDAEALLSRLPN